MTSDNFDVQVSGIAALGEPVRRSLYRYVVGQPQPVSRDEAAVGVGVPWHVAKFHLDRLEEDGLLEVEFRRPPGRSGPGAGRPTKFYRRSLRELAVSLPARRYDLAGQVMARAIAAVQAEGLPIADALHEAAGNIGRSIGEEARQRAADLGDRRARLSAAQEVIDEYGYESRADGDRLILANCPFHALVKEHTDLVCGMNLDLLRGLLDGLQAVDIEARLEPAPGRCCVTVGTP